jgi:hypothetical protein
MRLLRTLWICCGLLLPAAGLAQIDTVNHPLGDGGVDSLSVVPDTMVTNDSLRPSAPPARTPIPGEAEFGKVDERFEAKLDSMRSLQSMRPPPPPKGPLQRVERSLKRYQQTYGPRLFERPDGKLRLYLRFPQRDSLVLPFPKGFLPAPPRPPFDPTIAWQRSAVIPGLGQAYNRSYWKIPIWWAGYGAIGWWLNLNHQQYRRYGDAYFCAAVRDGIGCTIPSDLAGADAEGLRTQRNAFRSRRDNAVLWLIGWHSLQVIEAFIGAHLKGFDVSEDLTMKLSPAAPVAMFGLPVPGVGMSWHF